MGCSLLFVRPPPSEHEQLAYFDCVSSDAAPATDVVWTAVSGVIALAASYDDPDIEGDSSNAAAARSFGGLALLSAGSAVYGFITTSKCDSAKGQLAARALKMQQERDTLLAAAARTPVACRRDTECKGDRLCVNAACIDPPARTPPAGPTTWGAPAKGAVSPAPGAVPPPAAELPPPAAELPPAAPTGVLPPLPTGTPAPAANAPPH